MATEPEPLVAWATDCRDKYAAKGDNPQDRTWPGNHDSGYAGRILLSDGSLAWAAVVSDGAGGSEEGLKISALAVQAFVSAVRRSTLAELSDPAARDVWLRAWTKALHEEAWGRFKGGYATFCGAVILPPAGAARRDGPPSFGEAGWKLFSLNVGDSQVMKLTGDGRCMGIVPDAPPNNANVEGHNPIRVVGKEPKGDFPLLDVEEFPLPAEGPCWILAGSDGFFSKKKGKNELSIFSSGDFREICLSSGAPFHELPALAIRRSLENARKLDAASLMDNATVAMLGFRVPATDLAAPVPVSAVSAPVPKPEAPVPRPAPVRAPAPPKGGWGNTARVAACAAAAGVAVGVLAAALSLPGRFGGDSAADRSGESAVSPHPPLPDASVVPDIGLCARCWAARENGTLPAGETPFHWASECRHGGKGAR